MSLFKLGDLQKFIKPHKNSWRKIVMECSSKDYKFNVKIFLKDEKTVITQEFAQLTEDYDFEFIFANKGIEENYNIYFTEFYYNIPRLYNGMNILLNLNPKIEFKGIYYSKVKSEYEIFGEELDIYY